MVQVTDTPSRQAGLGWGQVVKLRKQLCSGQDDLQKQSGALGQRRVQGVGAGTGAAWLALPQSSGVLGLQKSNVCLAATL